MSNDVSRVYQFLANLGDWKTKADKNSDGTIIKSEFSSFMEENYDWDGETTDAGKNDLINSFWKAIDTNQGGKISGTRYKNKNALDSKEINAMQDRIAVYEKLNEYVADIQAPNEISDKAGWKKSISASLANTTETLIKQGVTADTLAEELDKIIENVKNKTTADYCANEYLNTSMKDVVKQYGYAYADDATLKGIIDNFVNNLPEDSDSASIKQTVEEIIDAYMATATGDGSEDISILEQYGYTPDNNTAMNDLQKSIVKTKLTEALADLKNEADYKNNSALYDTAINEYIEAMLKDKTYGDYTNNAIEYSLQAFKDSETGKALTKTIEVKNLFSSDEFKTALTNKFSEAIAEQLSGAMTSAFPAYDEIKTQALEKAQKGDFDSAGGNLDINKAIEWITEEVNNKLTEIFANNMNKLALSDFATIYDKSADAAKQNDDIAALRKAALSYCNTVAKRSTKLAEVVKEIFGNTYSTEINSMSNADIEANMTDLKAKVEEIGDPSTFTVSNWQGVADEVTMLSDASKSYQIKCAIKNGTKDIDPSRIGYKAIVNGSAGTASIDSEGKLTVTGKSSSGYITVKIYATVDDTQIGEPKTIKVKVTTGKLDWSIMNNTKVSGEITIDGNVNNQANQSIDLAKLYSSNGCIRLASWNGSWNTVQNNAKSTLASLLNTIKSACASYGNADTSALQKAYDKTLDLYTKLVTGANGRADKKSGATKTMQYDGENYSYYSNYWYRESTAHGASEAYAQGGQNNASGLQWNCSFAGDNSDEFYLNVRCLMDMFNKFYQQALTA